MSNAILIVDGKKPCALCKRVLPQEQFHRCANSASGLKPKCKECRKLLAQQDYQEHKTQRNAQRVESNLLVKIEVLTHYSRDKLSCVLCGYGDIRALSINHIEGGGTQHRKNLGCLNLYRWLRNQDYPEGYQTLCMNCQYIKRLTQHEWRK